MLTVLAVANYRTLQSLVTPLGKLNLVTGPNGAGKSNLYRALRLLAENAWAGGINALAREGGLASTFWAGPEQLSGAMKRGEQPITGTVSKEPKRLRLGFAGEDFSYSVSFGYPKPTSTYFKLDPEIKNEAIWAGPHYRIASVLVERNGPVIKMRAKRTWEVVEHNCALTDSIFDQMLDPGVAPVIFKLRETIRSWRFYDHFRTDRDAPVRHPQPGTRTPILHAEGHDLAAALQTIYEIGDAKALIRAIDDAFPGGSVTVATLSDGRFELLFQQPGLLRPLRAAELSDGTLRYLLWVAALLTPRPPSLMVLNEPETSLHPDLLPALARLIIHASQQTQVWVVSHAGPLIEALRDYDACQSIELTKEFGQTRIVGQNILDEPYWPWPD